MNKFDRVLVISHVAYRKESPLVPIEGPYASLGRALTMIIERVEILGIPLVGYDNEIFYGLVENSQKISLPIFLGLWLPLKFVTDILVIMVVLGKWSLTNWSRKKLVIGVDPLSCLPLWVFKKILGYTLVYHCVDFNKKRFGNSVLQWCYELADKWASRFADQTWVICEALKNYKKNIQHLESYYVPNSVAFDPNIYLNGQGFRTGNKMVWTGSLMTTRQFEILFQVLSAIQIKIKPEMEFVLAPTKEFEKFEEYVKKYKLKKTKVLKINGRREFQKMAARCDVGIALYDERFGSTEFIEPMKIWDFLLCGLPFIVSSEPSISKPIKISGVAYRLSPKNIIPDNKSLRNFLSKKNLAELAGPCIGLAKRFDIENQVKKRVRMLQLTVNKTHI